MMPLKCIGDFHMRNGHRGYLGNKMTPRVAMGDNVRRSICWADRSKLRKIYAGTKREIFYLICH